MRRESLDQSAQRDILMRSHPSRVRKAGEREEDVALEGHVDNHEKSRGCTLKHLGVRVVKERFKRLPLDRRERDLVPYLLNKLSSCPWHRLPPAGRASCPDRPGVVNGCEGPLAA